VFIRRDDTFRFTITAERRPALGTRVGRFFLQRVCATGEISRDSQGLHMATAPGQLVVQVPLSPVPAGFGEEAYTLCDEGVTMPTVVRERKPSYTPDAMRALKQGVVMLAAVVLPSGRVGDVVVTVSLDKEDGLDNEAVKALKDWRFKPGTRAGQPVPIIVTVEMTFRLT
jgi:TonB family protein